MPTLAPVYLEDSSGQAYLAANFYGIEWLVTFSNSGAGVLKVWLNGLQIVNATGLTTMAGQPGGCQ